MAELHYGKGQCSIVGNNIRGVEITFEGNISITDKTSEMYHIAAGRNKIVIFPVNLGEPLSDLFEYRGYFKIKSIVIADSDANIVACTIKKQMDFPEIIKTNPEDMTANPEKMSGNLRYGRKSKNTIVDKSIIENLNTDAVAAEKGITKDTKLYYEDGTSYSGSYHIHKDGTVMSGGTHTEDSVLLKHNIKIPRRYFPLPKSIIKLNKSAKGPY